MAGNVRYPSLYQINTRVWLRRLSRQQGKAVTLREVPDEELDRIAGLGFDWVWLLSVWQTGEASRAVSRGNPDWLKEFRETLPDLTEGDICGSGFAITGYTASKALGGAAALADMRRRLAKRGLKLMLDHVPNHTGLGHPWIETYPNYFVRGSEQDLQRQPRNFIRVEAGTGPRIFAYGRDPNFDGWADTLQLDYGNPELQDTRIAELLDIAGQCDGVRCDMAMLILPEVFRRTWGIDMAPFWPRAIARVREQYPRFLFMAEVYGDLEWTLQQQGFDYCYDKRLYDRLRDGRARPVRDHLVAPLDYQDKLARFLENHDEPRAAATFDLPRHRAAAAVTFLAPGLRFFHEGQFDGRRVRVSPHLCRAPDEPADAEIRTFYERLLAVLGEDVVRNGEWRRLEPEPTRPGDGSFDNVIGCVWRSQDGELLLVVVNYSDTRSQCRLRLPFDDLRNKRLRLADRLGEEAYDRDGTELLAPGLFVDHAPWHVNVFSISRT
jgi:glycosidase